MKISVAIATYNGERFIKQQLESILKQTRSVDEVIISDDCSTDKTVEICENFICQNKLGSWRVIQNTSNSGFCFNFYNAIGQCGGDLIFLADQDDVWHSDKVEKMTDCLNKFTNISVLASRYDVIDENSQIIENPSIPYLGTVFDGSVEYLPLESFIGCSYIRGFSMCFKREILKSFKPLELKSLLAHDWLFCMLGAITGKTAVLNIKLTNYRHHQSNVSLSDMSRKTLIGDSDKRLNGLRESIEAHTYVASLMQPDIQNETLKFAEFERKRLKFLKSKNPFIWICLFAYLRQYSRYYKGNGLRVWLGDFAYAYNLNFKVKKKI